MMNGVRRIGTGAGAARWPWAAIRAVARAERRAGWRALTVLALLFGLVAGGVAGAAAVAARTATAYPRLVEAVGLDDARVLVAADQAGVVDAVPTLPGVREAVVAPAWVARVEGPALQFVSIAAGLAQPGDLVHPVVVAGRDPDPQAADEVLVSEPLAEEAGLHVGSTLTLGLLSLDQVSRFAVGFGEPAGPAAAVRVVGVVRMPAWGGALANVLAGPGFTRAYGSAASARAAFVRLDGSADAAERFTAAFDALAAAAPRSVAAAYLAPRVVLPRADVDPAVATAERALVVGLAVFAVALGAGGLLVVGQALARHHAARRDTQLVEEALGLTRAERVGARVLAAVPAAAVAAAVAALLATAAGLLPPLGSQARFEPAPGFRLPGAAVAFGAVGAAVTFLLAGAVAAALAGARGARGPSGRPAAALAWLRGAPAIVVGVRLALRRRDGGPPAVAAPVAAAVAVAAIVATLAFGASAGRLVADPVRHGHAADLTVVDAREADVARIAADPRVAAVTLVRSTTVRLADGTTLPVQARVDRVGAVPVGAATGRAPAGPGEIALNPRSAAELGLGVGDVVEAVTPGGARLPLTVTGTVVAADENGHLGDLAVLDPAQLPALQEAKPLLSAEVVARPGQVAALQRELGGELELVGRSLPAEVRPLADLLRLPEILAVVLSVVAGAALVHALLSAARRHARDLAVMAALGATPAQARATLGVLSGVMVVPAVVVGVPLGLGLARVLWSEVATSAGVAGDLAAPVGLLTLAPPSLLLGALLMAPAARRAARDTPPPSAAR